MTTNNVLTLKQLMQEKGNFLFIYLFITHYCNHFSRRMNCVGIINSVYGKRKHQVPVVHKYLTIDPNSSYEWGVYLSLPAIYDKKCDGRGRHPAVDGGLACLPCLMMRKKNGNSNPSRWITKCYYEMLRIQEIRSRSSITPNDFKEIKCFRKNNKSRFTSDGLLLCNEIDSIYEYLKESIHLSNRINTKKEIVIEENVDSVDTFFSKAATAYKKNSSLRDSVIMCLLRAMVVKQKSGRLNVQKEEKLYDFFRYLRCLSPQASMFVSANCGLGGKAVSDRWMRQLNQKDRGECTFNSTVKNIYNFLRTKCEQVKQKNQVLVLSISIDATKVPRSLNINTTRKCIMGGSYPNHMISTEHLGKDCINKILENKDKTDSNKEAIELASEIKIAVVAFQNLPRNISPMAIIAARPQGNNETSSFTQDVCEAASILSKDLEDVRFANFATDGLSVETDDILQTLCLFLDGKISYCAAVDNKHNVKNDRYQLIGGSNVATMGNYYIDTNLLLMAGVSADLIAPKDFASDKKVEQLFSYSTMDKVDQEIEKGNIIGLQGDYGVLVVTFFFMRLHLFAVNALNVPAKHRAMYLGLSMMWFTSIYGIHNIPKRNIMMETIGNMFLSKFNYQSYNATLIFIILCSSTK